ncbi:MAG TPA: ABC transporter ATP-binding protein [Actinocrinis sp.]|jgi:ABC-type multidrug transport system ATPase subunit
MRLDGVGKRYGAAWVFREVDLLLEPGQVIAVTGGNGSGKSTLLRILAGVTRPIRGTVTGRPRSVGYVPERFVPSDRFSAAAYLAHMGRIRGLTTAQADAAADRLLTRLDLVGGRDTVVRRLSKGNVQKVVLAQALIVPPRLLILDEPWSGLDAAAHGVLSEIIREVSGAGGIVAFADHREAIVRATATTTCRFAAGRLTVVSETSTNSESNSNTNTGPDLPPPAVAGLNDVSRVLLRPPHGDGRTRHGPDWHSIEGVLDSTQTQDSDGAVSVRVTGSRCDALLLIALQHGWSVRGIWHHIQDQAPAIPVPATARDGAP